MDKCGQHTTTFGKQWQHIAKCCNLCALKADYGKM